MTPVPTPPDLRALTTLRFLAALWVVLYTAWPYLDVGFVPVAVTKGYLGVEAFFILSGFILSHVYLEAVGEKRFRYGGFLWARIARVYPLHLVTLFGMIALGMAATVAGLSIDGSLTGWRALPAHLTMTHAWGLAPSSAFNHPSWSISAEWFAYLLFPAFAWLALRFRARPWALLGTGAVAFVVFDALYVQAFGKVLPRAEDSLGILRIVPEFLIGMALYALGHRWRWSRPLAAATAMFATLLLLGAMQLTLDDRIIVALCAPVILTWSLLARADCEGPLAVPALVFAGEASFALYLVHMPVIIAFKGVVAELRGIDSAFRITPVELTGLFVVTALIAVALHLLVEKPGRTWIRRRFEGHRTEPAAPD